MTVDNDLTATFRAKVIFMKTWKPASTPSNRDRLELYALHKQAVSGDAPSTLSSSASGPEKAKYQAWRSKSGLSQMEAMRLYIQESDRQIRVYGSTAPQTPQPTPTGSENGRAPGTNNGGTTTVTDTPRGLAAIPLLCAAAAESRPAYLRRLSQTPYDAAWWRRQEPLCGSPGTLASFPETFLLQLARFVERLSLLTLPNNPARAFLWPVHNTCLGLWMLIILEMTIWHSILSIVQILVWGARRTGLSLNRVWNDDLGLTVQCIHGMCESHQAVTCRLVGLFLLPVTSVVGLLKRMVGSMTLASGIFVILALSTWWYFVFVLPWLAMCLLGMSLASGSCFALIEFAGV